MRAWAVVLVGTGVALCFVPLFNLLGFEFAFVLGIPATLCAGHLGVRAAAERPPWSAWWHAGRAAFLLVLLPLVPITLNAARVRNCDYLEGLGLYLLLPGLTAWVASGWGVVCGRVRRGMWVFVALVLATVAVGVARFWWQPPVDAFNPFLSYYPGALYDEVIAVDDRLLVSRLEDLAWAVAVVAVAAWRAASAPRVAAHRVAGVALIAALAVTGQAERSDIRRSADDVQAALGGRAESPRIVLHHPAGWSRSDVARLMTELEFAHAELVAFFGFVPSAPVQVYAHPDADTKKRLMGARRVRIAKPWQRAFHVHAPKVGDPVNMHEMAHVFSADIADAPLHLPFNGLLPHMALIEGLAVASTWDRGRLDAHQWTAAMQRIGVAPKLDALLAPTGFMGSSSGAAYTVCGSFSRYYREVAGPDALAEAYRVGRFEDLGTHAEAWRAFLAKEPLADETFAIAKARFDRPAIFQKVCAHEMAAIAAEARRLAGANDLEGALRETERLLSYVPGDVYAKLRRARLLHRLGRPDEARPVVAEVAGLETAGRVARDHATEHLGDLAAQSGDPATARTLWADVRTRAFDRGALRRLAVKIDLLEQLDRNEPERTVGSRAALTVLTAPPRDTKPLFADIEAVPEWPIGAYLAARRHLRKDRPARAVELLVAARPGLRDPSIRLETERLLAMTDFEAGRYAAAAARFEALAARTDLGLQRGEAAVLRTWARRSLFFGGR